jgi:hypothetical protein
MTKINKIYGASMILMLAATSAFADGTAVPVIADTEADAISMCVNQASQTTQLGAGQIVGMGIQATDTYPAGSYAVACNRNGTLIPAIGASESEAISLCQNGPSATTGLPAGQVVGLGIQVSGSYGPQAYSAVCMRPAKGSSTPGNS